ncbi:MAG TPA: UDP-N-acetylmuramoyl-L-alanine--D-glutamate ligase [Solirubrobacteraceae bacterium]|jgi:UDP-N-acetylmuramoylalanine--D-glutamate ligase|nr:UDP-N-acetylmuramoyl-L-alanine--D-glutamate ligase [Solirubrobacteraceae bacterium]
MYARFSELDGATVGVWGAGREIRSFADQLARRLPAARIAVAAFDGAPPADVHDALGAAARIVTGPDAVEALGGCDVLVRSPGVSIHRPELRALRAGGLPSRTPTGLWLGERRGRGVIGVTGTKGKSTTAALACHLARARGLPVHLAGNIGAPALDLLDADPDELAVVELSSYQIADLEVGPEVAVVTSLFREHLDWHGSEELYRAEKLRLIGLPGVRAAVLNARSEPLARAGVGAEVARVDYGLAGGWDVTDRGIELRGELALGRADLPLPGEHNALNLCGALTALEASGVPAPPLAEALAGFQGLPHRLDAIAERDGVLWIDDSISTTPESALAALASYPEREIVLIGGGQDRGQDYSALASELARREAMLVGLPSTGPRLVAAARAAGVAPARAIEASGMESAVAIARELGRPGAVILLSPAAPSYDHFRDFEDRGERFRALAELREPH